MNECSVAISVQQSPEEHADWLELAALRSAGRAASAADLITALRVGGSQDAVVDYDDASDDSGEAEVGDEEATSSDFLLEAKADAAFGELASRVAGCGDASNYPFDLDSNVLSLNAGREHSFYTLMSTLSAYAWKFKTFGHEGAKIFEEIATEAACKYFGAPNAAIKGRVFGFPRRLMPKDFPGALDSLCQELGEGGRHRRGPLSSEAQDAKLDVVVWRDFSDGHIGKLIAFGQCATGQHWDHKISELPRPSDWCDYWMVGKPVVEPIRCFFVPHRVSKARWEYACKFGGLLFDRCRIASLLGGPLPAKSDSSRWLQRMLKRVRKVTGD